ncbi:MAG: hydantoinase/oxoprolinase family protein [Blastocatellia bacterium]|nr:hydantoinase/oxoprolinase family protein [Blastocatellia bacterium]
MSFRLGIDVGGTFTDLLLFNESNGEIFLTKTLSTPLDQSVGVLDGIRKIVRQAGISADSINLILHGTTVATNAVLEGKGAKVGLITNAGFEQILHVARSQTPGPLAGWIIMVKPEPMAPLELTRGISARMDARGRELAPLDEEEAATAIRELAVQGIEALTISFLNAYANPAHERRVATLANELFPYLPVTISTDILPEFREYERTLTTVMNSYVRPKMRVYLNGIQRKLEIEGIPSQFNIVRSDGGVMSLQAAQESPVKTLLSGPSGGAVAAAYIGTLAGYPNVLSFDMGGTSTDVAVSYDGRPNIVRETRVGYYPVKAASVDVSTVGAGGGSIAHVPLTGALRVGPQSAGADPGPAAYGRGGTLPTVTDANVVLGYLPPKLLGGEMELDVEAAAIAVQTIAEALGVGLYEAAQGIIDIVNENMFGALRLVTVQKGYDPRQFALVPFGGAGPLHACALAELAGAWPVIVPPMPGVLSAFGFLHSDIKNEFSQSLIRTLDRLDRSEVISALQHLTEQARVWLAEERIPAEQQEVLHQVDMRYYRQGFEFAVDISPDAFTSETGLAAIIEQFKTIHEQHYGFNLDSPIEIVNVRAIALGKVRQVELTSHEPAGTDASAARLKDEHYIMYRGAPLETAIYDRDQLKPGHVIPGPAIVTQRDSTVLILPGYQGTVDSYLNILIRPVSVGTH